MATRPKRPRDPFQLAKLIGDISTGEVEEKPSNDSKKATSGRLGGIKGGKARAQKLNAKRRSEIAKQAAQARWKRKR